MRHPGGLLIAGRKSWFKIIENLYTRTCQTFLPCHQVCPDLLCETTDSEQVLFLPYELEYIQNQLRLTSNPFETILLSNQTYGYMSGKRECPYFKSPHCQIHDLRPFDCRSFPNPTEVRSQRVGAFLPLPLLPPVGQNWNTVHSIHHVQLGRPSL